MKKQKERERKKGRKEERKKGRKKEGKKERKAVRTREGLFQVAKGPYLGREEKDRY